VKLIEEKADDVAVSRHVTLSHSAHPDEMERHVTQFQMVGWPLKQSKPPKTSLAIIQLIVSTSCSLFILY